MYRLTKENGTTIIEQNPNWIKMNPRYPSFICCGYEDAECVILNEGEEQNQYNVNIVRYAEYPLVRVDRV